MLLRDDMEGLCKERGYKMGAELDELLPKERRVSASLALALLMHNGKSEAAANLLSYAIVPRVGVWWCYLCYRLVAEDIEKDKAQEICVALDKSGIPFSARYGENEMVLTYDGSYKEQVEEIIAKAQSGDYGALLRELQVCGEPDGYYRLLGEVAELLNTTIGALKNRPDEVRLALCKTYVDFWLCDTPTLQRELDRVISVNGRTISDIQEHEKIKEKAKAPSVPEQSAADTVPTLNELFDDYFRRNSHSHFSRERHQHLAEIARRRQQSEQERIIQNEERERKFRP